MKIDNVIELEEYLIGQIIPLLKTDRHVYQAINKTDIKTAIKILSHDVRYYALNKYCDYIELNHIDHGLAKKYGSHMEKRITERALQRIYENLTTTMPS